jgi:hypothetical protein
MARKSSSSQKQSNGGANLGFEAKLWQPADKMRGHMDASEKKGGEFYTTRCVLRLPVA